MEANKIAIIQPFVPTYRTDFFLGLTKEVDYDLYSFHEKHTKPREGLMEGNVSYIKLKLHRFFNLKWFNPIKILFNYNTIILCGEASILTNWFILIAGKVLNRSILIWGHGATYSKTNHISKFHLAMYCLSNGGIFYTPKEMRFWQMIFPKKKMSALYNTISVDQTLYKLLSNDQKSSKSKLKEKFGISQKTIFISCHRFTNKSRRIDLLHEIISESNPDESAFIIIGEGYLKPDFTDAKNVFDFGAVWGNKLKTELFFISDFYLQFGGTGLSIVEALAYGKPVVTLRRSKEISQGVEYYYLKNNYNSLILSNIENFYSSILLSPTQYEELSNNALLTYNNELQMSQMISNMKNSLVNK